MGSHSSALLAADSGIPPRRAAHTECRATGRSVAGKSTLADRLLQMCGVLDAEQTQGDNAQFLDQLEVERARGITVKAMHASLLHSPAARAEGGPTDTPLGAGLRLRDVRAPPPPSTSSSALCDWDVPPLHLCWAVDEHAVETTGALRRALRRGARLHAGAGGRAPPHSARCALSGSPLVR
jgi:hypothetical protein